MMKKCCLVKVRKESQKMKWRCNTSGSEKIWWQGGWVHWQESGWSGVGWEGYDEPENGSERSSFILKEFEDDAWMWYVNFSQSQAFFFLTAFGWFDKIRSKRSLRFKSFFEEILHKSIKTRNNLEWPESWYSSQVIKIQNKKSRLDQIKGYCSSEVENSKFFLKSQV